MRLIILSGEIWDETCRSTPLRRINWPPRQLSVTLMVPLRGQPVIRYEGNSNFE